MEEMKNVSVNEKDEKQQHKDLGSVIKNVLRVISYIMIIMVIVSAGLAAKTINVMLDSEKTEIEAACKYMERGEYESAQVILETYYNARYGEGYNEVFDILFEYRKEMGTSEECVSALLEECKSRQE